MSDESLDTYEGSGIAIIGMAGRFPGANDLDSYWRNLRDGVESISRLSDAELQAEGVDPGELRSPSYVRAAAVLDGVEQFDAGFFGYSPVEAEITDPQQRLLIECAWEALEHAGYNPDTYAQSIGVYAGSRTNTYVFNIVSDPHLFKSLGVFQISVGNDLASLATRISYKLNLRGPSYAVHTACSTSLVAVHLACQSLLIDECQMALAGGVAVNVPHKVGYLYEQGGVLSPDGHCRPFDADAGGTIFGSGAGMVLLKRLEDALRDGDTIHAVILGSATNNDGAVKASFTAPSVDGQAAVILDALAEAEVDPETIGYVEAHGTGTALGDPIEIRALTKAFRSETSKRQFCALGSVKSNIGHLDAAAGMSSLLKTVLALGHGQIPPSLHFQRPNPRIDFASSPFFVNTALRPWPKSETPRRAGVSSFGFGGTNAHLVLEEAPAQTASGPARPSMLLPLSARSPAALESVTQRLIAHLRANPDANLADVAYTLQVGRRAFDERRALVARDRDEALALLETLDPQRVFSATVSRAKRPVAFMFPGQGAQYAGMARDLYGHEAVFREAVDRCAALLQPLLGLDIRPLIFDEPERESTKDTKGTNGSGHTTAEPRTENQEPGGEARGLRREAWESGTSGNSKLKTQNSKLTETRFAQPALFAVEYALAQLWQSWGVVPSALIGHSIGEYVAATLAGVFRLEDALALVAARGRLMQALPAGAMLSVQLPEEELLPLLGEELSLAAANGPRACVVAGPEHAVAALEGRLAARGVQCRRLHTSHAFHSAMMDPVVETFTAEVARVQRQAPQLPFVSNRTGTWITAEQAADPRYWAEHLRHAVRFADGISTLLADPDRVLLEVGPGTTLSTFARQSAPNATALASLRHPNDQRADLAFALQTLGKLWLAGVGVGWEAFSAQERRRRVPLPTYPFERQRFWIAPAAPALPAPRRSAPLGKKSDLQEWFYLPTWHETAPPDAAPDTARRTWLLFADTGGLADALAQRLEQSGQDVLTVRPGALFGQTGPRDFSLDPQRPEDYARLIQAALDQGLRPSSVVHAWGLTAETPPETAADFATAQDHGFYSLVFLTQALGAAHQSDPIQIAVLASQTVGVEAGDPVSPAKATVLGACRVIPQEHLSLTCRAIDLAPAGDAEGLAQQAEQLLADLRGPADEPLVAYRGGRRLAQRFEPAPAPTTQARPPLRQGGVYLITGGLGGLGLLLGEHLARTVQARLVLVGRTALPPRAEWDTWVQARGEDDPVSRRLLGVRRLEAAGAEVLALDADVADPAQLRGVVAEARARFGAIHGVLHAAGLTRDADYAPVQTTTREMCERHFRSKPLGLLALEQALADEPVELWLLFSSLASVLGGLSYVAYAAANQALDVAAARPRADGAAWISVNWDSWHQESTAGVLGTTLVDLAISPSEGLAAFDQALVRRAPQLVVSTSALQPRIDQWVKLEALRGPAGADAAPSAPAALPPRAELERRLIGIWQRVLGVQQIGPNDNFFDLGGDSLSGMQLISELKRELHVQLAPVALFEAPSVSALARMLSPKDAPAGGAPATQRPADAAGPIAIVGMAGRFPGARDIAAFWRNLCDGRETIRFFADEELRAAGVDPAALSDPHYIKARPALDDIDRFDAAFFGYTPREAELMDPQHRFFLEVAWEALEQAGYADDAAGLPVGVFGGASLSAYLMNLYSNPDLLAGVDPLQTVIGNAQDSLTTSVSYKLNLKGPSLAVQTFCSTSLVAVHLASQSLQRGECSVALAGGVSILLPQQSGYRYQEGSILSPDGHCRPFDARAAGTLFGNGVGVVVLRRLEDALADGDTIYAVVKGSAINNDGSLKAGYTAPSVDGQA
ncbi:MAG TPA: type I polyketide synthase, partial [Roseiflexaceae bacterium]|nr:type I polyketide synthase [Roseiflexaceae bacterium]